MFDIEKFVYELELESKLNKERVGQLSSERTLEKENANKERESFLIDIEGQVLLKHNPLFQSLYSFFNQYDSSVRADAKLIAAFEEIIKTLNGKVDTFKKEYEALHSEHNKLQSIINKEKILSKEEGEAYIKSALKRYLNAIKKNKNPRKVFGIQLYQLMNSERYSLISYEHHAYNQALVKSNIDKNDVEDEEVEESVSENDN